MERYSICRGCHHVFDGFELFCPFCGSRQTGLMGHEIIRQPRRVGRLQLEQPDVYTQIHYKAQFRLMKGFALLRGTGEL